MKKLLFPLIIFFAILIYWPMPSQADNVGCGFTNLLYPTYLGTDGGTATCPSANQCLGYYFTLTAESDVSIDFTQGASNCTLNLYKKADYDHSMAKTWMKPSYSGRLATGDWRIEACPLHNLPFKLVVTATVVSSGGTPSVSSPSAPTKKSNGESCSATSECSGGYCVWSKCRSSGTYCGDSYCDSGESCSSCSSDCNACAETKGAGQSCTANAECESNNCRNWLCCESGRLCCSSHSQCTSGQYCGDTNAGSYCLPKRSNGVGCSADAMCENGYCANDVCASAPAPWCGDNVCNGTETCSSCYSDCGACSVSKKFDGESCSSESECTGQWCVHGICRSSHIYCGDGSCDTTSDPALKQYYESCQSCSADCGACDKEIKNLEIRTLSSAVIDKKGGAIQDLSIFYPSEYWTEIAKDASSPKAIKSAEKEIVGLLNKFKLDVKSAKLKIDVVSHALRVNLVYRRYAFPPNSYSGIQGYDGYWILPTVTISDNVEQGAFCKMDEHKMEVKGQKVLLEGKQTQAMESAMASTVIQQQFNQAFTLPKEAVDIQTDEEKCVIGYKLAGCNPTVQNSCGAKLFCSKKTYSCEPRLKNGEACDSGRACLSDNCGLYKEKNMCCGRGKACCLENSDCDSDQYCERQKSFNCLAKKKNGEKASSLFECQSNWLENSCCVAPKVLSFSFPKEVTLKKGAALSLPLAIQNVSQLEVALDEKILVSQSPDVIDVESGLLKIYKQTLAPNEAVGSEAEQLENSIDKLVIKAKKSGRGKMILKFNYVVEGQLAVWEAEIIINVSKEHTRAHSEATKLFSQKMIWEEIKNINNKEYVFVKPEDNAQFEGAVYNWQQAHAVFTSGIDDLMAEGVDIVQPDVVSFLVMVKGFNQAETPHQLTEKVFKTLIPASLQAGATFIGLMSSFAKQQKEERFLLKSFDVKDLTYIPDYDESNSFHGYIVAITKEKNGRIYAIQLGRL